MPKGSLGRFLVRSAWWQCVSPGTENYCVREHWAMLSPWTTPAEQSLGNLQSGRHNEKEKKHQSGEKHLCASSQLSEKAPLATTSAGVSREIAHLQWGGCRPGREPSPSLSSVYRSPCTLCTGPACSSCLDRSGNTCFSHVQIYLWFIWFKKITALTKITTNANISMCEILVTGVLKSLWSHSNHISCLITLIVKRLNA